MTERCDTCHDADVLSDATWHLRQMAEMADRLERHLASVMSDIPTEPKAIAGPGRLYRPGTDLVADVYTLRQSIREMLQVAEYEHRPATLDDCTCPVAPVAPVTYYPPESYGGAWTDGNIGR